MRRSLYTVLGVLFLPTTAFAYATAAVFTPTGEAMSGGMVCVFAYTSTNLSPGVSPASTWLGAQIGVLPQFNYGKGLHFGGLELGFDTISPYGDGIVKPVLNAKLGLVSEGMFSPSVGVGIMEISPGLSSMNFVYLSATKTIRLRDGPSFGRFTLGFGYNAGGRTQFNGTFPFRDTRVALMVAYASPAIAKRLGLVIDYLGGVSEISSTYVGATLSVTDSTRIAAGAYVANDRSNPTTTYDGFFAYIMVTLDALSLFKPSTKNRGMPGMSANDQFGDQHGSTQSPVS